MIREIFLVISIMEDRRNEDFHLDLGREGRRETGESTNGMAKDRESMGEAMGLFDLGVGFVELIQLRKSGVDNRGERKGEGVGRRGRHNSVSEFK